MAAAGRPFRGRRRPEVSEVKSVSPTIHPADAPLIDADFFRHRDQLIGHFQFRVPGLAGSRSRW
jgi:hypothetical protein